MNFRPLFHDRMHLKAIASHIARKISKHRECGENPWPRVVSKALGTINTTRNDNPHPQTTPPNAASHIPAHPPHHATHPPSPTPHPPALPHLPSAASLPPHVSHTPFDSKLTILLKPILDEFGPRPPLTVRSLIKNGLDGRSSGSRSYVAREEAHPLADCGENARRSGIEVAKEEGSSSPPHCHHHHIEKDVGADEGAPVEGVSAAAFAAEGLPQSAAAFAADGAAAFAADGAFSH